MALTKQRQNEIARIFIENAQLSSIVAALSPMERKETIEGLSLETDISCDELASFFECGGTTNLSEERQGEIALTIIRDAVFEAVVANGLNAQREIMEGLSLETGIPYNELFEFFEFTAIETAHEKYGLF